MSKLDKEFEFYRKQFTIKGNKVGEKYIRVIDNKITINEMSIEFNSSFWYRGIYLAFDSDSSRYMKSDKKYVIEICKAIDIIKDSDILSLIYDI